MRQAPSLRVIACFADRSSQISYATYRQIPSANGAYDPDRAPDPHQWLALDEQQRIDLAVAPHRRRKIKVPNIKAHGTFHAIIENQIAEQHPPVLRAMERLARQGLSRHDCIHAIGWVLARFVHTIMTVNSATASNAEYDAAVERLTAAGWLAMIEE